MKSALRDQKLLAGWGAPMRRLDTMDSVSPLDATGQQRKKWLQQEGL